MSQHLNLAFVLLFLAISACTARKHSERSALQESIRNGTKRLILAVEKKYYPKLHYLETLDKKAANILKSSNFDKATKKAREHGLSSLLYDGPHDVLDALNDWDQALSKYNENSFGCSGHYHKTLKRKEYLCLIKDATLLLKPSA